MFKKINFLLALTCFYTSINCQVNTPALDFDRISVSTLTSLSVGATGWTDHKGNVYVINSTSISRVAAGGTLTPVAGTDALGYADGNGANARFNNIGRIAFDLAGNLYVTDNNMVRKITPAGQVSTLAGSPEQGFQNGTGLAARFKNLAGIAMDVSGNLFVSDIGNNAVRKINGAGEVSTLVVDAVGGRLTGSVSLIIDDAGNLYSQSGYGSYKISPTGVISPYGVPGVVGFYNSVAFDKPGNVYTIANLPIYNEVQTSIVYKAFPSGSPASVLAGNYNGNQDGIGVDASFRPVVMLASTMPAIFMYQHRVICAR